MSQSAFTVVSHPPRDHGTHGGVGSTEGHGSRRGYVVGGILSAVLTALPFWLVMRGPAPADAVWVVGIIAASAVAQILVHTRYFLHVDTRAQGGWALVAFVFTAVLVAITIGGSMWIMYHLNGNMMPLGDATTPGSIGETR